MIKNRYNCQCCLTYTRVLRIQALPLFRAVTFVEGLLIFFLLIHSLLRIVQMQNYSRLGLAHLEEVRLF